MTRIATIDAGLAYQTRTFEDPDFASFFAKRIRISDLPKTDLCDLPCLMVPCRTNGARLAPYAAQLTEYIADGGTLVVMGETSPQLFIKDLTYKSEPTNFWWWLEKGSDLGVRIVVPTHPLMMRMRQQDVTWHIHGTLEFEAPAKTLVSWMDDRGRDRSILSIQNRGKGQLIITTLDPIYHHGSGFMPATTAFLHRFLPALSDVF